MNAETDTPQDEENHLHGEARDDSAPVASDLSYKPRSAWKPGRCVGYIVNWSSPVARVKWPKKTAKKDFFARINGRTDD